MSTDPRFDVPLRGVDVDPRTRCAHYRTERDVVAVRFPCCGVYYPCFECHEALADHEPERWRLDERDRRAVLCGACGATLSVREYLTADHRCPRCSVAFNPGCDAHAHLYFETETDGPDG
ncbi:CHY zinc finger protein [Halegenticoccus soli]|uniref:CHY zinc finger protein n=1 Tax=Halegenticoccus soli TaxID=1985678 RepID=UPI000C6EDB89|nr:CHY zinc finger protein [Halegenticoccus soli]